MDNNKNLLLKQRKQYNNYLPKYDIAVKPVSSGYQYGGGINTNSFNSTSGEDITPQVKATNSAAVAGALTKGGSYLASTAANLANNWTAKGGLSAIGKATAGVGAAYGAFDLASGIYQNYNDYRTPSDFQRASGTATQSFEGVDTTLYTGINENAERNYVDALNKKYTLSGMASGAGLGMSVGSLAGGPIGAGVGLLVGTALGGLTSLFGNANREEEVEKGMERFRGMQGGYNLQAASEAGSQGMRNKFNIKHGEGSGIVGANSGMDAYLPSAKTTESKAKKQKFGVVWGPDGKQFGPINSLVGRGESIIDYNTGKASYVDEGKKRVDNIGSVAQDGDRITIAGNDKDWLTGNTFANLVAPYTKMVETANRIIEGGEVKNQSKATKQKQIEEAMKLRNYALGQMKPITDRQQWQHGFKFNNGKIGKFVTGKYGRPVMPIEDGLSYPDWNKPFMESISRAYDDQVSNELRMKAPWMENIDTSRFAKIPLYTPTINEREDLLAELQQKALDARIGDNNFKKQEFGNGSSSLFKSFFNDFVPYGLMMMPAIDQWTYYKGNQPYAANSYVANPTARQALNVLGSMRYDPYNKIQAVKDANRQAIYSINHMGGLSRGQRMAMLTAQNNNYAKNIASIYGDADQVNNQYKQAFASALNAEGRDAATRSQQALATQQANYAKAVAAKRRGIETAQANAMNVFQKMIQDKSNLAMADRTLSMYQQDLDNRAKEIALKYAGANYGKDMFGKLKRRKR